MSKRFAHVAFCGWIKKGYLTATHRINKVNFVRLYFFHLFCDKLPAENTVGLKRELNNTKDDSKKI